MLASLPISVLFPPAGGGGGGFNGGKSQINSNFLSNSGDYPFINILKYGPSDPYWTMVSNVSAPPPNLLNADGYLIDLTGTGGGVYVQLFPPSPIDKPGNIKITWDGNGTLTLGGINVTLTPVIGSLTSSGGSGTYIFSMSAVPNPILSFGIGALGSPVITNIKIYNVNDEADLLAGKIFTADYINKVKEGNPGVFRFMNWQQTNASNVVNWAYRKKTSHWAWNANQFPSELYCGVSTNIANAFTVGVPSIHSSDGTTWVNGDSPKGGDTISVRWGATASDATCSLHVGTGGSSTDITMVEPGCTILSTAGNNLPTINRIATLIYDADLNLWMKWGLSFTDNGIDCGLPFEAIVELCTRVGCHPWINWPAYTLDPQTDYVDQGARFFASNLPSFCITRNENVNEVWNPLFFATGYGNAKSNAHWGSPNFHEWMGKVNSTTGQKLNQVYGGTPKTPTKYQMLCAVQTSTGNTVGSCATSSPRATSAAYVAQAAPPQSGFLKTAAYNYITHGTVANYTIGAYGGGLYTGVQTPYETTLQTTCGGVQFVASISGGNMVVSAINTSGGALSTGMILIGPGMPPTSDVTITGGSDPNWTISDSTRTFVAGTTFTACLTFQPAKDFVDTLNFPATFNGTIAGSVLTVNSTSSPTSGLGSIMPNMILSYADATCFLTSQITTTAGTGTGGTGTYNLTNSPGNIGPIAMQGFWQFDQNMLTVIFANWKQWALGMGSPIVNMNFYEGDYTPNYTQGGTGPYDILRYLGKFVTTTAHKATGLQGYTIDNYNLVNGLTGAGFVAEFPSCFQLNGAYPSNNAWSVLENIYQTPNPPQWAAIIAFNH